MIKVVLALLSPISSEYNFCKEGHWRNIHGYSSCSSEREEKLLEKLEGLK